MYRVFIFLVCFVMWSACQQEEQVPVASSDIHAAIDHAYMESAVAGIFPLVNALQAGPGAWAQVVAHTCATLDSITGDTAAFPANGPVTLHLRYADAGCLDIDGRIRSGRVTVTLTDALSIPGAVAIIATPDLKMDLHRFRYGMRDSMITADSAIVRVDSSFIFREGGWDRRLTGIYRYGFASGSGDPDHTNDAYLITATCDGIDREEGTYAAYTLDSLVFNMTCSWLMAGTVQLVPSEGVEQLLDYGSGVCDDLAAIEAQGQVIGLTIP